MKLATYLETNDITPEAFGKLIKTSRWAVSRYARGERIPRPEVMARIREATNNEVMAADFYDVQPSPIDSGGRTARAVP